MSNSNIPDLSGVSREELLQLIAAQQTQLRTQQQQQIAASLLSPSSRFGASAANSLLLGGGAAATNPLGASLLTASTAPRLPALPSSSAELLLRTPGLGTASDLQNPIGGSAAAAAVQHARTASELLQARAARLAATQQTQNLRQLMVQGLLDTPAIGGLAAAGGGLAAAGGGLAAAGGGAYAAGLGVTSNSQPQQRPWANIQASSGALEAAPQAQHPASPEGLSTTERLLNQAARVNRVNGPSLVGAMSTATATAAGGGSSSQDPPADNRHQDVPAPVGLVDCKPAASGSKPSKAASATAGAAAAANKKKTKRPLSAYNIFFKEEHAKIIAQNEREKAEKRARGETIVSSEDDYSEEEDKDGNKTGRKRKRSRSTNQPGKRGKRQVDFENLTKVIGKRWKDLSKERVDEYKRRAEEAMQAYRKNLFQKIRNSVKEDQY